MCEKVEDRKEKGLDAGQELCSDSEHLMMKGRLFCQELSK